MKNYTLSRGEMTRLSKDPGELAEDIAADVYQGYSAFTNAEWYDLQKESGAIGEVKSTATRLESGSKGRFRLWKDQHTRLSRADRNGSARYVFVLFDVSSRPVTASLVQRRPAKIGRVIGGRGGFSPTVHPSGPEHKLPYAAVF